MSNEFVPYELAVKLKELGFDEPCLTCYDKLEMIASHSKNVFDYKNYNTSGYMVSRPTFSQAFRWFRDKYMLVGVPTHQSYDIWNTITGECFIEIYPLNSYEEAELLCLKKLIEIVEQQNEK